MFIFLNICICQFCISVFVISVYLYLSASNPKGCFSSPTVKTYPGLFSIRTVVNSGKICVLNLQVKYVYLYISNICCPKT